MKKKYIRLIAAVLCIFIMSTMCGICFASEVSEDDPQNTGKGIFFDRGEDQDKDKTEDETTSDEGNTEKSTVKQYTVDDIERMNNGNFTILFSDEGYMTFLRGKYYDGKVENVEDGIESLFGIQSLLGLSKGSEFYGVFGERDAKGYTYYTYQQRYGDTTLQNAVLKVIVDPDGYTAGVVSSFVPEVGIAPEDEYAISKEAAIRVVQAEYPQEKFHFFTEETRQTSVSFDGVAIHFWAVFTDIPSESGMIGDRSILEHLVSYDGKYYGYMAVTSTGEYEHGDDLYTAVALSWFEGKTAEEYTAVVTLHDGTQKELTVPVVKDEADGRYYLADPERHILVADYYSFEYEKTLVPMSTADNTGWPDHYLLTYETYMKVFDFYNSQGLYSVDGFGMPILILADCCYYDGTPIDNAFFSGFERGWATFGASAVNDYGECIDVIGHEFTHGITSYTLAGDLYENESGAVNEALSDIFGNLIEMMLNETDDEEWLIAENSGDTVRSMSFPWLYRQPVTVNGTFFQNMDAKPSSYNDMGGVHTNSSLVNYIAWQLYAQGMSLEQEYQLWMETINLLTPASGFREIHHALLFAADILELDIKWSGIIEMLCEQAGY